MKNSTFDRSFGLFAVLPSRVHPSSGKAHQRRIEVYPDVEQAKLIGGRKRFFDACCQRGLGVGGQSVHDAHVESRGAYRQSKERPNRTMAEPRGPDFEALTARERDCLRLVTYERKSAVIAETLGIAPGTVDLHLKRARAKLGGMNRFKAAEILRRYEAGTPSLDTPQLGIVAPPRTFDDVATGAADTQSAPPTEVAEVQAIFTPQPSIPVLPVSEGSSHDLSRGRRLLQMLLALMLISLIALATRPIAQEFMRLAEFVVTHLRN